MNRSATAAALLLGAILLASCHKNAWEFDSILVPALPADSFNPTWLIDREGADGSHFLVPPRDNFSQTTLLTGQVLIAGGTSGGTALHGAQIYDQRAAGFFSTGSLVEPRRGHTATLTAGGDVVVVGGIGTAGAPLATAEIYTTATGSWRRVELMAIPRFGHTATRLSDGDILVAGGVTSVFGTVTDRCEILDVDSLRFTEATPIQAWPGAAFGRARAFHTATAVPASVAPPLGDEGPCDPGNTQDVVVLIGGLTGSPGGPATAMAASVGVFFPLETTPGPGGADQPGAWREMALGGNGASALRWAHQAHRVLCDPHPQLPGVAPSVSILVVGGIASFSAPLGALTSSVPGAGLLEDSRTPEFSYSRLTIPFASLAPPGDPMGDFSFEACIGDPLCDPAFAGGAGARSVFHEASGTILYAGGNSFSAASATRTPYSRQAYLIDPAGLMHSASLSQMWGERSFFGMSFLPGPDEALGTDDDTVLVVGGEFAPTAESGTAEEYAFP